MVEKNCVRVFPDEAQIEECRAFLNYKRDMIMDLAKLHGLIGNEVRTRILFLLDRQEKLCVCDLVDILEMKAPAVSQHLRKLYDGGLIIKERVGSTIFYHLSADHEDMISEWLKPLYGKGKVETVPGKERLE